MITKANISMIVIPARFLIIALSILFFVQVCSSFASEIEESETTRKAEKIKIEEKIRRGQVNIQRLQTGLENQQEGVEKSKQKEKGVLADLKDLDIKLLKLAERLNTLETQKSTQQELIGEKESELKEVQAKTDIVQNHMQKRVSAYYKLGKVDLMNITFSTKTMPELLRFHDSFQSVIAYDQQVMKKYKQTIKELKSAKMALSLERGLLDEFIAQASEKELSIREVREQKNILLNKVRSQEALHKQAIKELKKAKSDLASALLQMKKKEQILDQGFLLAKKKHIAPLNGEVISRYNEERTNEFGIKRRNPGIAISAPDGSKVRAIYDGKVIFSGYLNGYGNTIIIDHGYQYYTISSRIERILASKGTKLKRNDIIGVMGSTATILDDGLYFEIRHNETPLDPLDWLNRKELSFAK